MFVRNKDVVGRDEITSNHHEFTKRLLAEKSVRPTPRGRENITRSLPKLIIVSIGLHSVFLCHYLAVTLVIC